MKFKTIKTTILIAGIILALGLSACGTKKSTSEGSAAGTGGKETTAEATKGTASSTEQSKTAATSAATAASDEKDAEIKEQLYNNFLSIAAIPRGTYNEQEVSNYLKSWAESKGYSVTQDKVNNIIFDVPATAGCEDKPLTILQGHMDMVVAVADGKVFDKEKDAITVIRNGDILTADGTSLGADNGIGIAMIMYIVENNENHGPLRIIITTDEEQTSTGVNNLDPAFAKEAKYMINMDDGISNEIIMSSAGATAFTVSKKVTTAAPTGDTPLEISVTGSAGGHSGNNISEGRANSIVLLVDVLSRIQEEGISYQLVSMEGGEVKNAIPTSAKAVITTAFDNTEKITKLVETCKEEFISAYGNKNPNLSCDVAYPNLLVQNVISDEDLNAVLGFAQNACSGVYTMSQKVEGLVESSSNLGIIKVDSSEINMVLLMRSSEAAPEKHLKSAYERLAAAFGFSIDSKKSSKNWPVNADSELSKLARDAYLELTGTEPEIVAIHGGLECGAFLEMNPDLDVISIGPDIGDEHSINESLDLASAVKTVKFTEMILGKL